MTTLDPELQDELSAFLGTAPDDVPPEVVIVDPTADAGSPDTESGNTDASCCDPGPDTRGPVVEDVVRAGDSDQCPSRLPETEEPRRLEESQWTSAPVTSRAASPGLPGTPDPWDSQGSLSDTDDASVVAHVAGCPQFNQFKSPFDSTRECHDQDVTLLRGRLKRQGFLWLSNGMGRSATSVFQQCFGVPKPQAGQPPSVVRLFPAEGHGSAYKVAVGVLKDGIAKLLVDHLKTIFKVDADPTLSSLTLHVHHPGVCNDRARYFPIPAHATEVLGVSSPTVPGDACCSTCAGDLDAAQTRLAGLRRTAVRQCATCRRGDTGIVLAYILLDDGAHGTPAFRTSQSTIWRRPERTSAGCLLLATDWPHAIITTSNAKKPVASRLLRFVFRMPRAAISALRGP